MKREKKLKTNVAAVWPCSVMLTKLDIEHNKQYTEKENVKTNGTEDQDQDQDVSVEEQPKKKTWDRFAISEKRFKILCPMVPQKEMYLSLWHKASSSLSHAKQPFGQ